MVIDGYTEKLMSQEELRMQLVAIQAQLEGAMTVQLLYPMMKFQFSDEGQGDGD